MRKKSEMQAFRTWIEIFEPALEDNYKIFRKLIEPNVKLLGVIKSNAYGHGLMTVGRALDSLGADWIGVDSISEAVRLRQEEVAKPILVLGYTQPENFSLASKFKVSLAVSTFENLKALAKTNRKLSIHIKVDTGMHRQGFFVSDLPKVLKQLKKLPQVKVEGLFTHFAAAKDARDTEDTNRQIKQFEEAVQLVKAAGFKPICHAAATGGTINFPSSHFDMVRIGIGMYGLWPSEETKELFGNVLKLEPVLTWKTVISELKWVEKGERVGYNYTEELAKKTLIAVLPIGYWHGFWRAFSSRAHVLVKGSRCRVLGRVSMDMIVVDVTDVPSVKVGEEVVLIGRQGYNEITADELAELADTTCYEIVTRLNPLIKKYLVTNT